MPLLSFGRIVAMRARETPARVAVTSADRSIRWRELDLSTNRIARAYERAGIKANDLVTLALPNSIEFFQACIALWKLGATPQPVSYRLPTRELAEIAALARTPLVVGVAPDKLPEYRVIPPDFTPGAEFLDTPLADAVARHWKAPTSGGSTGRPKLIVSMAPSELDPDQETMFRSLTPGGTMLIPGPLYHNGPFTYAMQGLMHGNEIVVENRFDAESTLRAIQQHRVTWTFLVPTMMHRIWRLERAVRERYDLSTLRTVLHSASPCPAWLKEAWIEWLGPDRVQEIYGGTEAQGATWITGAEWRQHRGSVGRAMEGCRLKICDDQGRELPPGEQGLVYFLPATGQGTTYRYVGSQARAIEGGWETLGDIGKLDADGYLYLADRQDDLIICGGANVYPAEVEAAIESHPAVRSSIVIGLQDADLGQRVHALVDAPGGLNEASLLEHLAKQIVRYKIPRSFEWVSHPLRDETGKARRYALARERSVPSSAT